MNVESWSARDVLNRYREKTLSPVEVMTATIAQIERCNPSVNAFVLFDGDKAMAKARDSERRWYQGAPCGPLDGVPTTIKDAIAVKGWPTRQGSSATSELPDLEDAPVVTSLRNDGAVIIGKTTMPEFGFKSATDSILNGITRNPWDTDLTPGGSSGGACAAAALGMGLLHIGTDGGGSIRQPASFCGVSGFKPSSGCIPNLPLPLYRNILCSGPIARRVSDCALMFASMANLDSRDPFCYPTAFNQSTTDFDVSDFKTINIAYFADMGIACSPEISRKVEDALLTMADLGANITRLDWTWTSLVTVMSTFVECHKAHNLKSLDTRKREEVDPDYIEMAARANHKTLMNYLDALQAMDSFANAMATFMQSYDIIITPSVPVLPFDVNDKSPEGLHAIDWYELESFNYPFSLSGQPAINVPVGFSTSGLPIGWQMVGRKFEDNRLLKIAEAFQAQIPDVLRTWPHLDVGQSLA